MTDVRMDRVWDEAVAFTRAEAGLLVPVALAFMGVPALLLSLASPTTQALQAGQGVGTMLLILPVYGLLSLFAGLAIANLVLRPGERVADALEHASRRLGTAVLATLLIAIGMTVAVIVLAILFALAALIAGVPITDRATPAFTALTVILIMAPLLLVMIRLSALCPRIASGTEGPLDVIVGAWRETGPVAWRLVLITVLFNVAVQVALLALNFGLGSLGGLLAGAAGSLARLAVAVIGAGVSAAAGGFWSVFLACLHRALTGHGGPEVSTIFE